MEAIKVSFLQIDSSNITTAPIIEGQLIFTTDTHKLYRDINGRRVAIATGGSRSVISTQEPPGLSVGDLWFIKE